MLVLCESKSIHMHLLLAGKEAARAAATNGCRRGGGQQLHLLLPSAASFFRDPEAHERIQNTPMRTVL